MRIRKTKKRRRRRIYIFRIRSGKNVCVAKQEEVKRIVESSPNNFQK